MLEQWRGGLWHDQALPLVQVDFLPSKAMTAEEIAQQQSLFESLAKATRSITVEVDGEPLEVQVGCLPAQC